MLDSRVGTGSTSSMRIYPGVPSGRDVRRLGVSLFCVLFVILLAGPSAVRAQVPLFPEEVERIDVIAVERDGRELYAFDALSGGRSTIRLEVGENVLFEKSRGRIGIVLTDRRMLGVVSGAGWSELRVGVQEQAPTEALLGDQVAVLVSNRRAIGFASTSGWFTEKFGPSESATALRVGSAVGVIVTNRRALGASPAAGGFAGQDLQVREKLESIATQDTLATVRTERRILVYSAPRTLWTEQKRRIN